MTVVFLLMYPFTNFIELFQMLIINYRWIKMYIISVVWSLTVTIFQIHVYILNTQIVLLWTVQGTKPTDDRME